MKKLHLILALCLFSLSGLAQDLIVTKRGERIFCRIVRVDSSVIVYRRPPSQVEISLARSEVQNYHATKLEQPGQSGKELRAEEFDPEVLLIQLRIGQASPLGDFASQDVQKETAGLAGTGFGFEASALLRPVPILGMGLAYVNQSHPFSEKRIEEAFESYYPGVSFRCDAGSWKIGGVMADIIITLPFRQVLGLSMDFGIRAGFPRYHFPKITIAAEYNGVVETITQEAEPARAGTIAAGIGLAYRFTPAVALTAGATYLQGKPSFAMVARSNFGPTSYSSYDQKVTALTIHIGLRVIISQAQVR